MKEKILELRKQGKTYNEIHKELGCSKSTISYHCGEGQKEKAKDRINKHRNTIKGNITRRVLHFLSRKARDFKNSSSYGEKKITTSKFSAKDIVDKFGLNPKCYLTGKNIDLLDFKSYQFDHIIPVNKGGNNDLDNLGIVTRNANMSKVDMNLEEYIDLCKSVLINFNYKLEYSSKEEHSPDMRKVVVS